MPVDFTWSNEFRSYVPMAALRKKVIIFDELPKWEPLRNYPKPWILRQSQKVENAPSESDKELKEEKKLFSKFSNWLGKKTDNMVAPAE